MKGRIQRAVAATGAALMLAVGLYVPQAAGAQDLSSQVNAGINAAVNQANAEWNKFVQMANDALPAGSSLPGAPAPAPLPPLQIGP